MQKKIVQQKIGNINFNSWLTENFGQLKIFKTLSILFNVLSQEIVPESEKKLGELSKFNLKSREFILSDSGFAFLKDIFLRSTTKSFADKLTCFDTTEIIYLENPETKENYPAGIIFNTNINEHKYYFNWLDLNKSLGSKFCENINIKIPQMINSYFDKFVLTVNIQTKKQTALASRDYWRLPLEEAKRLETEVQEKYAYAGTFELLEVTYPKYFSADDSHSHDFQELLLLHHQLFSGRAVLEVGCGATAINLLHALKLGAKSVAGTEISLLNVVLAQANIQYAQDTGQISELSEDQVQISLTDTIDENIPAEIILFNAPGVANSKIIKDNFHTYHIPAEIFSKLFKSIKNIMLKRKAQALIRINLHYDCGLVPEISDKLIIPKYFIEYKHGKDFNAWPDYYNNFLKIDTRKEMFIFRNGFIGAMRKIAAKCNTREEEKQLLEYFDFLERMGNYENIYRRAKYYIGLNDLNLEPFVWQERYKDLFVIKARQQ